MKPNREKDRKCKTHTEGNGEHHDKDSTYYDPGDGWPVESKYTVQYPVDGGSVVMADLPFPLP